MGNQVSIGNLPGTTIPTLPNNITLVGNLGGGKLLKSLRCHYKADNVVVKVYSKRHGNDNISKLESRLQDIQNRLVGDGKGAYGNGHTDSPGILLYNQVLDTTNATFLIRSYVAATIVDRFHILPFLKDMEKRWITYQLLQAMGQLEDKNILHLSIRFENVLVTSWNWVFIADLGFFKPQYLPADNPAEYSLYYPIGRRHACYIAPERFFHKMAKKDDLTTQSDLFSIGCVIADIYLEGREALFDHAGVLSYKDGVYDPSSILNTISDVNAREIINTLIHIDPQSRSSARQILEKYTGSFFPSYFRSLYSFFSQVITPKCRTPKDRIALVRDNFEEILQEVVNCETDILTNFARIGHSSAKPDFSRIIKDKRKVASQMSQEMKTVTRTELDKFDDRIRAKVECITDSLMDGKYNTERTSTKKRTVARVSSIFSNKYKQPEQIRELDQVILKQAERRFSKSAVDSENDGGVSFRPEQSRFVSVESKRCGSGDGLLPVLSLLCTFMKSSNDSMTQLIALYLIFEISKFTDDDVRLTRVVPFFINMIIRKKDDSSTVSASNRASALVLLTEVLSLVSVIPSADLFIFPEYIFPALSSLPSDSERLVQLAYARIIAILAELSNKFLNIGASRKIEGKEVNGYDGSYDKDLNQLHMLVHRTVEEMMHSSTSKIKAALISDITRLAVFFGKERVNEKLLPLMISVLNNKKDWELRVCFFEHIVGIGAFVGKESLQNYILPCIEHAVYDVEEFVALRAVEALTVLCELDLFEMQVIEDLASKVSPMLCHPSCWIRRAAVNFVIAISSKLGSAKTHVYLCPRLRGCLKEEIYGVTKETLIQFLRKPLSRAAYSRALLKYSDEVTGGKVRASVVGPSSYVDTKFEGDSNDDEILAIMSSFIKNVASRAVYYESGSVQSESIHRQYSRLNEEVQLRSVSGSMTTPKSVLLDYQQDEKKEEHDSSDIHSMNALISRGRGKAQDSCLVDMLYNRLTTEPDFSLGVHSKPVIETKLKSLSSQVRKALKVPMEMPDVGQYMLREASLSRSPFFRNHRPPFASVIPDELNPRSWRPKGILVSDLREHSSAVNKLAVSRDNIFMVSCSDDGTVKIWDAKKLKSISAHSRLTYQQEGRLLDITICDCSHSFASVSSSGTIHVCKVEYSIDRQDNSAQKYVGCAMVKSLEPDEGAILAVEHANTITESLLMFGSQTGIVHSWDLRSQYEPWHFDIPLFCGSVTTLHLGPNQYCLIAGTNRGYVIVWDLRFQIPIQTWRHSSKMKITHIYSIPGSSAIPSGRSLSHPESGPLVFVCALGVNEVSAFDLYTGELRESYRVQAPSFTSANPLRGRNLESPSSAYKMSNDEKDVPKMVPAISKTFSIQSPRNMAPVSAIPSLIPFIGKEGRHDSLSPDYADIAETFSDVIHDREHVSSMLCCDSSFILTGGSDSVIRYWDLQDPSSSYRVSTPKDEIEGGHLFYKAHMENASVFFEEVLAKDTVEAPEPGSDESKRISKMKKASVRTPTGSFTSFSSQDSYRCVRARGPVWMDSHHRDVITDLKCFEYPQKMLVSACRDGGIKVWV